MARSMSTAAAEGEADPARVTVDVDRFRETARGYLEGAGDLLSPGERGLLVTAARLITYEQGVRFLTDYLDGDRYYRTAHPGQNLERARAQLTLLEGFTRAEPDLMRQIERFTTP